MRRNSGQTADICRDIIRCVRLNDGISRVDLSRELNLAPSTVGAYVERMISDQYLMETRKRHSKDSGRPPTLLKTNPNGGYFVGVDFEARNIMAVSVDFSDQPQKYAFGEVEDGDDVEKVLAKVEAAIDEVIQGNRKPLAIGVGSPGLVNADEGIALHYKYIHGWNNVPLASRFSKRFRIPVFVENNVRTMALAELWFGQGRGLKHLLCVGVRSGVGTGMILDGQLYTGFRHTAGELGRWKTAGDVTLDQSLVRQSGADAGLVELQEVCSLRAIMRALEIATTSQQGSFLARRPKPFSVTDVVQAIQLRDSVAVRIVESSAAQLGRAIGQLIVIADPAKVVLTGQVTQFGNTFMLPLANAVRATLAGTGIEMPDVMASSMGEYCGALGAAALALHQWKPDLGSTP